MEPISKKCCACNLTKLAGEFARHKTRGLQTYCRPCSVDKSRQWAKANPEKKRQHKMDSRHSDIERDRLNRRNHYARNAEVLRTKSANQSPEKRRVRADRQKIYRARNPEKIRQLNRARIHSQRAAGSLSRSQIERLIALQKRRCAVCRRLTVKGAKGFHLDHKTPLSRGGTNEFGNLQILCPTCNVRKSAKDPIQFMQELGFLL